MLSDFSYDVWRFRKVAATQLAQRLLAVFEPSTGVIMSMGPFLVTRLFQNALHPDLSPAVGRLGFPHQIAQSQSVAFAR